ncbi:MAG: hypothetical protein WC340_04740 [Kiritimatiellia bacterium]
MKKFYIIASSILCMLNVFAQAFGTQSGYNAMIDIQRSGWASNEKWNNAVKLSLFEEKEISHSEQSQSDCIDISDSNLKIGDSGKMSYWIFTVETVLNSTNCVLNIGPKSDRSTFILSEYPTEKLVDNMKVVLTDEIEFVGTQQVGDRKLLVLKLIKQLKVPTKNRKWHSADGRSIVGSIQSINHDNKTIELIRSDGRVFSDFPLSKLRADEIRLIAP